MKEKIFLFKVSKKSNEEGKKENTNVKKVFKGRPGTSEHLV